MAEAILERLGRERFSAFSAGSHPAGSVNPAALRLLRERGYDTAALRSKSWDEFAGPDGPAFDFVITVCDSAAGESCPVWHGDPLTVHWGIPDPAANTVPDEEARRAFADAYTALATRIEKLLELPLDSMSADERREALRAIHAGDDRKD